MSLVVLTKDGKEKTIEITKQIETMGLVKVKEYVYSKIKELGLEGCEISIE